MYSDEELLALSERQIDEHLNPLDRGMAKLSSRDLIRLGELERDLFLEKAENAKGFLELAQLMGFSLSNYDELEDLTPQDIGANLELRAWIFELNVTSEVYFSDFGELSDERKKQIIENHIRSPIAHEGEWHKSKKAVEKMKIPFSWEPSDNGALWTGEYQTYDSSINDRICVAIDPYAPLDDIQASIKALIFNQQKAIEKAFPPTPKGGRNQQAFKEKIIKTKVVPILDLYIIKSYFNLYSCSTTYAKVEEFHHGELEAFKNLIQQWDDQYRRFEGSLFKFLREPFIFWMKSNKSEQKNFTTDFR